MSTTKTILGILAVVNLVAVGCADASDSSAMQEDGAGNELTGASLTVQRLFGNVAPGEPICFAKAYTAAHLASHPKQTIKAFRVELWQPDSDSGFGDQHHAKITFQQDGPNGAKIRELSCEDRNGTVLCAEEQSCASSVEIRDGAGNGIRVVNKQLRASGACDETPKPLDGSAGADDVFDLPALSSCSEGELANLPTVDCTTALTSHDVRTCSDVFQDPECPAANRIRKGERYADEEQLSAVAGQRLESEEACIQRYSDPAAEDACCGQ